LELKGLEEADKTGFPSQYSFQQRLHTILELKGLEEADKTGFRV
jgi:hypothetical protein